MGAVEAFPFAWQGAKPIKNRDLMIQFSKCSGLRFSTPAAFFTCESRWLQSAADGRPHSRLPPCPHYAARLLRRKFVNGFGMIRRSGPHHRRRKFRMVGRIRKVL